MAASLLFFATVALQLAKFQCWSEYTIPADAIQIGAEELVADQLPYHLMELMANGSSSSISNDLTGKADDHHHLPTALMRLDALLRSAEERKRRLETSSGRVLSINRGGYFRGLLIVWVPVSFLLPTLAHFKPSSHYRNDRRSQSFRQQVATNKEINYDPTSADYSFEDHYGPLLSRIDGYFSLLRIDNLSCKWKLLCHVGRQSQEFQPLSNLFQRLFERSQLFPRPETYHPALKKFFTYLWAEKKGRRMSSTAQCDEEYSTCSIPVDKLIRTDMLLFWQNLSKRFAIQLQDE